MVQSVIELLELKKQLFLKYEQASIALTYSDIEQMEFIVDEREQLKEEIDQIDVKINQSAIAGQYGEAVWKAIKNQLNRSEVVSELLPLFDKGQEIFAAVNRIMQMEPLIIKHIEETQKELEQKIKSSNSIPKIKKYFDTIQTDLEDGSLIRSTSKKI